MICLLQIIMCLVIADKLPDTASIGKDLNCYHVIVYVDIYLLGWVLNSFKLKVLSQKLI